MGKKIGLILLGLVLLAASLGGWFWLRPKLEEGFLVGDRGAASTKAETELIEPEKVNGPVELFVSGLIDCAELEALVEPANFNWKYRQEGEVADEPVTGAGFQLTGLGVDDLQRVRQCLRDEGMESDLYNQASGTVGSQEGYYKDELVCLLTSGVEDLDATEKTYSLQIGCGLLNSNLVIEPLVSTEEALRQAFADKYSKPLADVLLEVNDEFKPFATGVVRFQGEIGGAMWLAYRDNGVWEIVWDGNGTIPCATVNQYQFPAAMVPECWDEVNSQLVTR